MNLSSADNEKYINNLRKDTYYIEISFVRNLWKMSSNSFFICFIIYNVTWALLSKPCRVQSSKTIGRQEHKTHLSIVFFFDRKWWLQFLYLFVISRETQTQVYCFFIWNKNVQMKRHGFWSLFSHCERKLWKENMLSYFCIIWDSSKPLWYNAFYSILLYTYFIQPIT